MLIENHKVAIVTMVHGANTTKKYVFALYDKNIKIDDLVLCDTQYGYSVAQVVNVIDQSEYKGVNITKEIICKVDFEDFKKRAEMKTKMKNLKSAMDKKWTKR